MLHWSPQILSPIFSSRSFIFLGIIFNSVINLNHLSYGVEPMNQSAFFFCIWISNFSSTFYLLFESITRIHLVFHWIIDISVSLLKVNWPYLYWYYCTITGLRILFYYLFAYLDAQTMLSWLRYFFIILKSGMPPNLFFFKVVLDILSPFHFHVNFKIRILISIKKSMLQFWYGLISM